MSPHLHGRIQQLTAELATLTPYQGIDTISRLSRDDQIAWILQHSNPRLRAALRSLVRAGHGAQPHPRRQHRALLEVLAIVYLRPADHDTVAENATWCEALAEQHVDSATEDAARRVMTEMFDRTLVAQDATIDQVRLFIWAVDEGLASGRRVWDRELLIHGCCWIARRAREEGNAAEAMFWLDRAQHTLDSLSRPDPWIAVRVGGGRALALAALGRHRDAVAAATEVSLLAARIGSDQWVERLAVLVDGPSTPNASMLDDI